MKSEHKGELRRQVSLFKEPRMNGKILRFMKFFWFISFRTLNIFLDKGPKIIIQKNLVYDRVLHRWFARA